MCIQTPSFNPVFVALCYVNIWALIHCCFSDTHSGTVLTDQAFYRITKTRTLFLQHFFFECMLLSSVQSLSRVWLFATPWTIALQASLSITNSWSLFKLMSIESVGHPTISSSVVPFSSCLQSFPTSGSFPMNQFFASGGQRVGISASASGVPMYIQD